MKKFLRTLVIIILLGCAFLLIKKNTTRLATQTPTSTGNIQTTWLVFVNDAWFAKKLVGGLEGLREEPDGLADLEKCKIDPASFGWWMEKCDDIQTRLDTYVLADYAFEYSGFSVFVLDMKTVSWHKQMLANGILELTQTWIYPINLVKNILTNTIWMNRGWISGVIDISDQQFPNADITRMFISFEGQDAFSPVIQIIFKKWNYLVKIRNMNRAYPFGGSENKLSPLLSSLMKNFYDAQMTLVEQDTNHELKSEKLIEVYTTTLGANPEYIAHMNQTIANALSRFAIQ